MYTLQQLNEVSMSTSSITRSLCHQMSLLVARNVSNVRENKEFTYSTKGSSQEIFNIHLTKSYVSRRGV